MAEFEFPAVIPQAPADIRALARRAYNLDAMFHAQAHLASRIVIEQAETLGIEVTETEDSMIKMSAMVALLCSKYNPSTGDALPVSR